MLSSPTCPHTCSGQRCASSKPGLQSERLWVWTPSFPSLAGELQRLAALTCYHGKGNGTPLQYSCMENPMDGGAWCCSPWGHCKLNTTEQLHFHFSLSCIGEGNGNPLQCSCLENLRDGGAWWAACRLWGCTESDTTEVT